jgi:hypothetical protein
MTLNNQDISNIIMLLDRVEVRGISESYVLAGLHNKLKSMIEQDQEEETPSQAEDQKGKKPTK